MKLSWDNITMENYAAIDSLNRTTPADYTQHMVSLLSLVSNIPETYFEELPLSKLQSEIIDCVSFLKSEPDAKLIKKFWHKGRRYTIKLTQDEVTTGQAMGVSALKLNAENMAAKMPELLAAITEETKIPFRKKLTFAQKVDSFKTLRSSIGIAVCLFFWEVSKELQEVSLRYLEREAAKLQKLMDQIK